MERKTHIAIVAITLLSLLLGLTVPMRAAAADAPAALPAPLPAGSPTATVNLSSTTGYIGQSITVTGQTNAAASAVRIAWLHSGAQQTVTAATAVTNGSSYSAQVSVPLDAQPGPAQVCATVTNAPSARFTCASFTIARPPAGKITGQAPGVNGAGATFVLLDRSGATVASTAIAGNGTFQLNDIAPGRYQAAVEGNSAQPIRVDDIVVTPGDPTVAPFGSWIRETNLDGSPCLLNNDAKVAQISGSPSHINSDGVVDLDTMSVVARSMLAGSYKGPSPKPAPQSTYDFGLYLNGVALNVEFTAYVQRRNDTAVDRVEYYRQSGGAAPVLIGLANAKPWKIQYDVGQLPVGQNKLIAVPVVNGVQQCVTTKIIQVLADPIKNPKFQPGAVTVWDNNFHAYHFHGTMPNVGGLLPAQFDTPSLPLVGVLENRMGAGVYVEGWLYLDGQLWLGALDAQAYARLMSIDVLNKTLDLDPGGKLLGQWIKPQDVAAVSHQTPPYSLASFKQELTLFGGPLFAVPPWVVVRASISIGVGGDISLSAMIQPLKPGIELELRPSVSAWLGLTVAIDIIFGIAGAEGTAQPGLSLALPLKMNPDVDPPVWFDDPCLSIFVRLILKGRFLFWTWTILDEPIIDEHIPSGCNAQRVKDELQAISAQPASSATLEAPFIAADPTGRMAMVYVEDAGGATPAPRIMARFKPVGSSAWSAPQAVSDGTRSVSDPVVAFAGSANTPVVAWTQNSLSLQASAPTTGDLTAVLRQQEIMVATWNGATWSPPDALTGDQVGDGRPALAGDAAGATLAWTRDTDGDIATRTDQRIAVREWTPVAGGTSGVWSAMRLLGAAASGMNAQVDAARLLAFDPAGGQIERRALAWSFDADGDPNTNSDRRLAVATYNAGGWSTQLLGEQTRRADSPAIALSAQDPDHAQLAFLIRGKDGDGQTDIGPLSNRAQLWTAIYGFADGSVSNVHPAPDENGAPVYAERPRLMSGGDGETLLAFRRFGMPEDNTWLGQIALAQSVGGSAYSAPLLLTDEPRQNWQTALALNPDNGQAVIAKIGSAPVLPLGASSDQVAALLAGPVDARFGWARIGMERNATTLDILTLGTAADPALEPALALAQVHPLSGSTVTVTATVRNLGRSMTSEASVCFYRGTPGAGGLVSCRNIAPLGFNSRRDVAVDLVAGSGAQSIYAQIATPGENANTHNDIAIGDLGALPAPEMLGVQESTLYESSLAAKWLPTPVPGVAGYRILRSSQPGGPYELVGESRETVFNDLPVARGQTYYYVVQAFDSAGVLSDRSVETSGMLPLLQTFLPLVRR